MRKIIIPVILFAPLFMSAQELHENVSVEGKYKPIIVKAERYNTFPERKDFTLPVVPLNFDTEGAHADFIPAGGRMEYAGFGATRENPTRGYVALSLGSWLNSSLSAGYSAVRTRNTRLDISLQHNSTSLWQPYAKLFDGSSKRFRYDESFAARFSHTFDEVGTLEASLQYRLGYFNYYSYLPATYDPTAGGAVPKAPTQTLNDLAFNAGWYPATGGGGSTWFADAALRHFAYRALPLPGEGSGTLQTLKGDRETHLNVNAGYAFDWEGGSSLGIDASVNALFYAKTRKQGVVLTPDDYFMLTLTPGYRYAAKNLLINIGAVIDITSGAMGDSRGSHYSAFHIAPDLRADWQGSGASLSFRLGGGSKLRTLAGKAYSEYYCMPALISTQPIYTPVDARLGMNIGPFGGFSAGFDVAFRINCHTGYNGWYPTLLNYGKTAPAALNLPASVTPLYSLWDDTRTLKGWQISARAQWELRKVLKLSAALAWMPQNGRFGWEEEGVQSRWHLTLRGEVRPVSKLRIGVSYEYRGVRNIALLCRDYTLNSDVSINTRSNASRRMMRLEDLTMLGADATWDLTDRISLGVRADNLLNHRFNVLPSLPMEGIDVQGVLNFRF